MAYVTCANNLDVETLLRMVAVDSDGNAYIDCDNDELSIEDLIKLIIVEDDDGNPAIAVFVDSAAPMDFTTTLNQTAFDTTGTLVLNNGYKIFVDGQYQSWGHTRAGNVVTFAVPFAIGHEVSIQL